MHPSLSSQQTDCTEPHMGDRIGEERDTCKQLTYSGPSCQHHSCTTHVFRLDCFELILRIIRQRQIFFNRLHRICERKGHGSCRCGRVRNNTSRLESCMRKRKTTNGALRFWVSLTRFRHGGATPQALPGCLDSVFVWPEPYNLAGFLAAGPSGKDCVIHCALLQIGAGEERSSEHSTRERPPRR
jgi:hypothetical protein